MKAGLVAAAFALVALIPGVAEAKAPSPQHTRTYLRLYREVRHEFGARAPGRNIVRDGLSGHRALTDAAIVKSIDELRLMLAPPPAPPNPVQSGSGFSPTANATAYVPAVAGGYCGGYQFDYSTWKSIGMPGSPCGAPPSLQDQAAIKLHQLRGDEPWPHCGHYWSQGLAALRKCENSGSYH